MEPTSGQIKSQLDEIETLIRDDISDRMVWRTRVESELAENTKVTTQVRDLATTGRTIRKVVIWLGSLAAGFVGLWQLWQVFQ